MTTASYQGRRVQVVGDARRGVADENGVLHLNESPERFLIKFEGETRLYSLEVDASELSDYIEVDETPPQYIKHGTTVIFK